MSEPIVLVMKEPCRLIECSNSQRTPVTGVVEWLTVEDIVAWNQQNVMTTRRYYPLTRDEQKDLVILYETQPEISFTIQISQKTVNSLRNALTVRMMAGTTAGLPEAFLNRVLQCIEESKTEHLFEIKRKPD